MPHELNLQQVDVAFSSGELLEAGKRVTFQVHELGRLFITSGAIAAADPFVLPNTTPYLQAVPNGRHPVCVAVARFDSGDERVAFARARFTDSTATGWKMALAAGQDAASLGPDHYFGYGVDSGTGCFMDPVAGRLLSQLMDADSSYYDAVDEEMQKTYRPTWSWLDWRPSKGAEENIICFSSGWGDGSYASFFGFDADGRVSALVTDFAVLYGEEAAPRSKVPWWRFWKQS
ncbi:MAG TPA: DUF4241 domain-containing protein [Burkholderiales bacterium]|nr:DUF4241 domain-containing protein [Burkholderiales bacterium]